MTTRNNLLNRMIFIPGWGFRAAIWSHLPHYPQTIALSLPELQHISLANLANYFYHKIPRATILVGWSLGGLVATKLAALLKDKVSKLILISATPKFLADAQWTGISSQVADDFLLRAKGDMPGLLSFFFNLVNYPNKDLAIRNKLKKYLLDEASPPFLLDYLKFLFNSDVRKEYATLKLPLLHILGECDGVIKTTANDLARLNSQAQLVTIKGAGHVPFITHAEIFSQTLDDFLYAD